MVRRIDVDFPGLRVGTAEYDDGPTGCTVIALDRIAAVTIDVRGGLPGVYHASTQWAEAVCIAGGSILGLEASAGVAAEIFRQRDSDAYRLPAITGGVIYDLAAPERNAAVYPDAALGAQALRSAEPGFVPVGRVGAGRSATCGKMGRPGWAEPGGQGAAFGLAGAARILVVVVVNALGVVVDRSGAVVRGNRDPATGERSHISPEDMAFGYQRQLERFSRSASTATTQTVVLTDMRLTARDHVQLGRQIHASMARAIHPFHCTGDGDTLWLLSTGTVADSGVVPTAFGVIASELAWDAILEAVAD